MWFATVLLAVCKLIGRRALARNLTAHPSTLAHFKWISQKAGIPPRTISLRRGATVRSSFTSTSNSHVTSVCKEHTVRKAATHRTGQVEGRWCLMITNRTHLVHTSRKCHNTARGAGTEPHAESTHYTAQPTTHTLHNASHAHYTTQPHKQDPHTNLRRGVHSASTPAVRGPSPPHRTVVLAREPSHLPRAHVPTHEGARQETTNTRTRKYRMSHRTHQTHQTHNSLAGNAGTVRSGLRIQ
jgi:hypothetical protein